MKQNRTAGSVTCYGHECSLYCYIKLLPVSNYLFVGSIDCFVSGKVFFKSY